MPIVGKFVTLKKVPSQYMELYTNISDVYYELKE